jgi:hypothetical protein
LRSDHGIDRHEVCGSVTVLSSWEISIFKEAVATAKKKSIKKKVKKKAKKQKK